MENVGGQRGHYCSDAAASFDGDGRRDNDSGDEVITARPCKMVNGQGAAQGDLEEALASGQRGVRDLLNAWMSSRNGKLHNKRKQKPRMIKLENGKLLKQIAS